MIKRELERIEQGIIGLGRSSTLASLRAGLEAGAVRGILAQCGLPSSQELEEVYRWRDGTDAERATSLGDIYLFPGFYLLSLEDAAANYKAFASDPRWRPGWLPVFANGGGDFYVLELGGSFAGAVRHFRIDESDHPVEFESLASMLHTLAEAFKLDVFYVDPDGYLEMDDLEFATVAARINPNVAWWHD